MLVCAALGFDEYDEKYSCKNGEQSSKRFLILTPHDKYFSTAFLSNYSSKTQNLTNGRIHAYPVAVTGNLGDHCVTFIELPLMFTNLDIFYAMLDISERPGNS